MGNLEGKGKWDVYAQPEKYLYAVEDLGSGSQGRVWLTSSSSGAICVLKFPKNKNKEGSNLVQQEVVLWERLYPEFAVFADLWSGRSAIRMPHFASIPDDRRNGLLPSVRLALERFENEGYVHGDVTWANIGQYTSDNGEAVAVVYDFGHVRDQRATDQGWVSRAIQDLQG